MYILLYILFLNKTKYMERMFRVKKCFYLHSLHIPLVKSNVHSTATSSEPFFLIDSQENSSPSSQYKSV